MQKRVPRPATDRLLQQLAQDVAGPIGEATYLPLALPRRPQIGSRIETTILTANSKFQLPNLQSPISKRTPSLIPRHVWVIGCWVFVCNLVFEIWIFELRKTKTFSE